MTKILVVDDNAANRQFLVTLLSYMHYEVLEAADGAEGLAVNLFARPDLIISDILMPTMDGFEFVKQLRDNPQTSAANVIFYTAAYREYEARALARSCGVQYILTKPAEPQTVLDTVAEALGHRSPAPVMPPAVELDREHLRVVGDKLGQKVQELEVMTQRLSILVDLVRDLASQYEPEQLLETVARAGRELLGASLAAACRLSADGDSLLQFKIHGIGDSLLADLAQPSPQHPLIQTIIADRKALRMKNPGGDVQRFGLSYAHPPVYSYLAVPIASPAHVYGWLSLCNKLGTDGFSAEDEQLATTLAAQAGVAFENTRRYEEIQQHAAQLEQRVLQRTAQLCGSNAALEQFAYVASHDLQEPLRKIVGFTQLLAKRYQGQLDTEADEFIGYVVDGAARMQSLIQDLLAYSRVGSKELNTTQVNIADVLAEALANLSMSIEEQGALVTSDALPTLSADRTQMVQIFQNLIGNAVKYHGEQPPRVHVHADQNAGEWRFTVGDNGLGIAPQYSERIFRVFQRLHGREQYPGTGIGLAICRRAVERHGGRIWIEPQAGPGTIFYFTIPNDQPKGSA